MNRRLTAVLALCTVGVGVAAEPAHPLSPALRATASAYAAADRAFTAGDLPLARDLTRALTERFPDDPAIWLRVAVIEQKLGAFDEALTAFDAALDVEAAYSIDGGRTLAQIHLQRASLLVAEAQRDVAASGAAPLGSSYDTKRADLQRALAQVATASAAGEAKTRGVSPARGYVVETGAQAPADREKQP